MTEIIDKYVVHKYSPKILKYKGFYILCKDFLYCIES